MTDIDEEEEEEVGPPRTAVFPVVDLPAGVTDAAGLVLLLSGALLVASGAIQALTYRVPGPTSLPGLPSLQSVQLHLTAADRIQLLARGAGLFPAILVLLAAVCLVTAGRTKDRWRAVALTVAGIVAGVVTVGNVALCAAIIVKARGDLINTAMANRFSSITGLLGAVLVGAGVLFYVVTYLTADAAALHGD